MCLCRQGIMGYLVKLSSIITVLCFQDYFPMQMGLWPRCGVGVTCGCCVNRAELQLAVIRHHLYSLLWAWPGSAGLLRTSPILSHEPGPEVGGLRLAVTSNGDTHFGTKSLGWIRVAGTNMFVVVAALLILLRV